MAEATTVVAELRDRAGKGAARATRRAGRIPAVIYGNKQSPVNIAVDGKVLTRLVEDPSFFTHTLEIQVNGETHKVLPRDVQVDPLTDRPIHADFLRYSATTKVEVNVPVTFINEEESPGLKRGGVLNIVRREVELRCSATAIPEELVFDLTGLEIGDSIHIEAIQLPDGVEPTVERNFTVATIAAPSALRSEEEAADAEAAEAAAAEGESAAQEEQDEEEE